MTYVKSLICPSYINLILRNTRNSLNGRDIQGTDMGEISLPRGKLRRGPFVQSGGPWPHAPIVRCVKAVTLLQQERP